MITAVRTGLKARHLRAWAEVSPTSAGPGNRSQIISQGLKGRNKTITLFRHDVPPFQGGEICLGIFTRGYARSASPPAVTLRAFSPAGISEQQRIVAKVDELLRWCDALEAWLTAARTSATLHQILTAEKK
jgi:hypothetical protein